MINGLSDSSLEGSRDQAAGFNFRWIWKDSKAEIYANIITMIQNMRDFLLDDH